MKEYIWKFLAVIFSLNLFLSGISNSMMPTPNKNVVDYSTGEEIPLGGIDKEEVLPDGTKLIYVSKVKIKEYEQTIKFMLDEENKRRRLDIAHMFLMLGKLGVFCIGSAVSYLTDSNIPMVAAGVYCSDMIFESTRLLYRKATSSPKQYKEKYEEEADLRRHIGHRVWDLEDIKSKEYQYGLVLIQRPFSKEMKRSSYHSAAYNANGFRKDRFIEEIAKGY